MNLTSMIDAAVSGMISYPCHTRVPTVVVYE